MALRDAIDLTALGWVKPDLDELLRQARVAIESSEDMEADQVAAGMRDCANLLHQVRGTLSMLDLTVPALVAEEMERVAQALGNDEVDAQAQALDVLHRGVVLLPDYLERLQGGHREIPIVLLPLLNELRAARGAELLGEGALFDAGAADGANEAMPAPTEAEIAHAQGSLSGRNRSVLGAVSSVLKEDLHRIQDALDLYLRGGRVSIGELAPQVEALDRAADTLAMLGLGQTRELLQEKRNALHALVQSGTAGEAELLGVASGLLQAHAALDQRVDDLGGDAESGGAGSIDSRELVSALAREAVANFSSIRQGLVAFIESSWEHDQLVELPRLFVEVAGGLRMLEMQRAAEATDAIRVYVERELLQASGVPGSRQLDTLADAISSLEYYLEVLVTQGASRDDILEISCNSLETLGYWPIPVAAQAQEPVEVQAPSAAPEPAPAPPAAGFTADMPAPVAAVQPQARQQGGFELAGDDIDDEIREVFLEEFAEEMDNLSRLIPAWREAPADMERLRPIRRVFHTLKGSGRLVGAVSLGEFSWKVENMLNRVLDDTRPASPAVLALVDHAREALPQLHAALRGEGHPGQELSAIQAVADRLAAGEEALYTPTPRVAEPVVEAAEPATEGLPAQVEPVLLEILDSEVGGHLQTVDAWVARATRDGRVDDGLMRSIHTMSGAFAMAEVPAVGEVLLPAEGLVKRLLAADQPADADIIEALTDLASTVRATMAALQVESPRVRPQPALAERLKRLRDALPEPAPEAQRFLYQPEPESTDADDAAEAERLEAERAEAERLEAERLEAERLEAERLEAERLEAERLEAERLEAERLEAERLEAERLEAERLEAERLEAERLEAERLEAERLEAERLEAERLEAERLEAERLEAERLEAERLEAERLEAERLEAERLEAERLEAERLEAERLEAERLEAERLEAERLEAERLEAERLEAERLEAERLEAERLEAERLEAERLQELLRDAEEAGRASAPASDDVCELEDRIRSEEAALEKMHGEHAPARAIRRAEKELDDSRKQLAALVAQSDEASAPEQTAEVAEHPQPAADVVGVPDEQGADEEDRRPLDVSDLDLELVDIFAEETGDLLDHSDGLLADLRTNRDNREAMVGLQRDLHTIKGGARMAGIMAVGELGHAMESLLEAVVEQRVELGEHGVPLLEQGYDRLHAMVTRVNERLAIDVPHGLVEAFNAHARGESVVAGVADAVPAAAERTAEATPAGDAAAEAGSPAEALPALSAPMSDAFDFDEDEVQVRAPQEQVRIRADLLDRLVNYAGEVAIYRARLEQQLGAFRSAMQEMEQTNTRLYDQLRRLDIETEAQIIARYQREHDKSDATFDPLELDRFSTLQQLSRALNESATDLTSLQGTLDDLTRQYETLLLQQSRVSSDLQEGLMRTRMVPFSGLVPRLRRVVRQAAADTGKKVQLTLDGTQGELDRNVLERMTAPLEHMLRNAVAHGVESVAARQSAGKPEEGTISIAVRTEGSEVVLQVGDDGAGLNREAIRRRGEARGLIAPGAELRDEVIDALIMQPGFSTADEVSRLAGRGVGMDVVASEVRQLGGSIDIRSEPGQGSRFILRLPQMLAVTQAVFVRIGETTFAVPIASVRGVGRIRREDLASGDAQYRYGGDDYAVHDLGLLLGQAPAKAEGQLQMPLLLVGSGDMRAAVTIDEVIGNREIVVKPVGPQVASLPGIFGATIMGDGSVVVILDVAPLVRRQMVAPQDIVVAPTVVDDHQVPLVMVVDDSVTMRKVTSRVLERNGYEVLTAKDGIDALERMAERVPDLMLLDIEMPRMDGYELATEMQADARLRDVSIMMITSRTGEKHRQRAFDIGVKRYLGKPYQEHELMRNVEELLEAAGHQIQGKANA